MTETPKVAEKEFTMTLQDLQTILDYLSKRPLGEVLEVFKAVQRAKPVEPEAPVQQEESQEPTSEA